MIYNLGECAYFFTGKLFCKKNPNFISYFLIKQL